MLKFDHVAKTYRTLLGATVAVTDFDLEVAGGELVGVIGSNGSGKTTLIHLALGYLNPTAGSIQVFDRPAGAPETRSRLGWVPDEPIYPRNATTRGLLNDWLAGQSVSRPERTKRVEELLDRFGMAHAADRRINTYSLGMQQKTSLMLALSHEPTLLILDEPFSALDHRSLLAVRRALSDFSRNGGAVLVSSHHLSELESLCSRAVFLGDGKIQREELLDRGGVARVHFEIGDGDHARSVLENGCPDWFDEWEIRGQTLLGRVRQRERLADLIAFLVEQDVRILSAGESTSRLEEVYLEMEGSE